MRNMQWLVGVLSAAMLLGCGGGGGGGAGTVAPGGSAGNGGGTPIVTPGGTWLSFTPASVEVAAYEGEAATFSITGTATRTFAQSFNIGIVDSKGIITTDVDVRVLTATSYQATLRTSANLSPGVHQSYLEVRLCEDSPTVCKTPLPGSPWKVPLTLQVKPASSLTVLTELPGLGAWSTYGGTASHGNYVPASFDPTRFSRRWTQAGGVWNEPLAALAHDGGLVFTTHAAKSSGQLDVVAISEESGKEVWRTSLGTLTRTQSHVNAPAAANGKVYVTSTGEGSGLWVFDQRTGVLLSKIAFVAQWGTYMSPTVFGTDVYTSSGYIEGLSKIDTIAGKQAWFAPLTTYGGWTPAADSNYAYGYVGGSLQAFRAAGGNAEFKIADPSSGSSPVRDSRVPVLSDKQMAYVTENGRLVAFDLASRSRAWVVDGRIDSMPAYAKGVLYVLAGDRAVEARAADTGGLLWTAKIDATEVLPGQTFRELVVSDNLIFASNESMTVAIDMTSRKIVWQEKRGGRLSISSRGVLYIMSPLGQITAVNLH